MNPFEDTLRKFCQDEVMYHAVRNLMFSHFDANDIQSVARFERESAVQAIFDGRARLEAAFKEIEKYKARPQVEGTQTNPV